MVVKPEMEKLIDELAEWFQLQPQLPQRIERTVLQRFLHTMMGDVEAAKKLLAINYGLRNKYPQIFIERDPLDGSSQQLLQVADLIPLPGLTPAKNKLLFYRLRDHDADKFNLTAGVKVFFMVGDCRFIVEDTAGMPEGEIPIFDMAGYSLRHLTKTVFSSLRIYMKFVQEAHPVRLKEIHVLNCPSYLDKVLTVVKPFIKSEVFKLIHFHLPNADTPYQFFPKEMLPDEYGGAAGKLDDLKAQWNAVLEEKRDYLMDSSLWKVAKSKAPSACASESGVSSSFRALEID